MPSTWNKVWVEGDEYNTAAVFNTYVGAINERLLALDFTRQLPTVTAGTIAHADATRANAVVGSTGGVVDSRPLYYTCSALDYAQSATNATPTMSWYALQMMTVFLATRFTDRDQVGSGKSNVHYTSNAYDHDTYYGTTFSGGSSSGAEGNFLSWPQLLFRFPNVLGLGLTRKRDREITSLSAPGVDGQVARFVRFDDTYSIDGPYTRNTNLFPDQAATATGDRANALKIYQHSGGAWIEHPDQTTRPDIITLRQLARPGDHFGPHLLNEMRDVLNLCTCTNAGATFVRTNSGFTALRGRRKSYNGSFVTEAVTGLPPACIGRPGSSWEARENYIYARAPTHCARTFRFYWGAVPPASSGLTSVWDANGFTLTARLDQYFETNYVTEIGPTTQEFVVGPLLGNADVVPAASTSTTIRGWDSMRSSGDTEGAANAVAFWDVPGGFAYTSATV